MFSGSSPLVLRIFLGSPGDVLDERVLTMQTLMQLPYDPLLFGKVFIQIVAWDNLQGGVPMQANLTPQEAIRRGLPKPSECDMAVFLFGSRMGTPLPPEEIKPEKYRYDVEGISDDRYMSGSEWEYVDAMQANERSGNPAVLVYHRISAISLDPNDPEFNEKHTQYKRLKALLASFRDSASGAIRHGYNEYTDPADFQTQFEKHIKCFINERLKEPLSKGDQFKEELINADYLEAVSSGKYDAKFVQAFALRITNEPPLRIRALELCFKWGFLDEVFLERTQQDHNADVRKALASNIGKYGVPVSEGIVSALLRDDSLSVEHAAIDAALVLIPKGQFSSAILRHTNNSEYWEVVNRAVGRIISFDDKDAVTTLSHFKDAYSHTTRNRIREYFERLCRENRLNGEDCSTALALLTHYANDGRSSETTTKKLNGTLKAIQEKCSQVHDND